MIADCGLRSLVPREPAAPAQPIPCNMLPRFSARVLTAAGAVASSVALFTAPSVTSPLTCAPVHPPHHHSSGTTAFDYKRGVGVGKSWGYGQMGQLGHGIETDEAVPRTIEFLKDYSVRSLTSSGPRYGDGSDR